MVTAYMSTVTFCVPIARRITKTMHALVPKAMHKKTPYHLQLCTSIIALNMIVLSENYIFLCIIATVNN